jgi:hypothetical protein
VRNILIAIVAVAVLVAASLWYLIDRGMFDVAEDEAPAVADSSGGSSASRPGSGEKAPDRTQEKTQAKTGAPASAEQAAAPADASAAADGRTAPQPQDSGQDGGQDSGKTPAAVDGDRKSAQQVVTDIADRTKMAPTDGGKAAPAAPADADKAVPTAPADDGKAAAPGDHTAPSFDVVRIAREGTAVLAGRGAPGSVIELRRDDEVVATATVDALGEWVIVLDHPLPEGPGELGLASTTPDGRQVVADATLAVDVPKRGAGAGAGAGDDAGKPAAVAVLVPHSGDKQSRILQKPAAATADTPDVTVDKVDYDEAGNVVVAGTAAPGKTVRLYVDNKPVGDTTTGEQGQWSMTPTAPIAAGQHTLRADRLGSAGAVEARVEIPFDRAQRRDILKLAAHRRVIVQPGNSLWRISRRVYGSGLQYTVIYQANSRQIRDPDLIYPGQVFDLPKEQQVTN